MEERKAGCGRVQVDGVRGNEAGVGRAHRYRGGPPRRPRAAATASSSPESTGPCHRAPAPPPAPRRAPQSLNLDWTRVGVRVTMGTIRRFGTGLGAASWLIVSSPIPRVGGTAFWHSNWSGGISCPSVFSASLHIFTTMFFSVVSIVSEPSPSTVNENLSALSTVTRFHTSSAKPKESKPGPRLAVVAGTLTTTRFTWESPRHRGKS